MVDDMSGVRYVAFWFVLFALVSSVSVLGVEAVGVEDGAVSVVEGADAAVVEAYEAALEAEGAGANVSELLGRLDVAGECLAVANVSLRLGDFDGAVGNASLCVEALDGIVDEAEVLRDDAIRRSNERSLVAVGGSLVGVAVVALGCWLSWSWFKKRYHRRVLEMKPEVVEG